MSRDLVLISSYWRPEFLYLCLENLSKCDGASEKEYWVFQDFKENDNIRFADDAPELNWVIEQWSKKLNIKAFVRPPNNYYGGSHNCLRALKKAFETDARYVYWVEDDVFVTPDFFKWHEYNKFDGCWCTIAGKTDQSDKDREEPNIDFLSRWYRSLGTCWKRENLVSIVKHCVPEYYASAQHMAYYIKANFPETDIDPAVMVEYDGLITRVMRQEKQEALYAGIPKAYHVGVYGYHRSIGQANMPVGNLQERIEFFRKKLSDPVWLNKVADFQTDIQSFPVNK